MPRVFRPRLCGVASPSVRYEVGWFLPVGTSGHGGLRPTLALVSSPAWRRPIYASRWVGKTYPVLIHLAHAQKLRGLVRSPASHTGWLLAALYRTTRRVGSDRLLRCFELLLHPNRIHHGGKIVLVVFNLLGEDVRVLGAGGGHFLEQHTHCGR